MTSNRDQRLFDAIRAAAFARDLQPEDSYTYHFSSDTYEEETLLLIDEQKLQQQEDSSGNHILGESRIEQVQIDAAAAAPAPAPAAAPAAANDEIFAKKKDDDELATRSSSTHEEKTNHQAATKITHQGQEEIMTNSILVHTGKIDSTNGPFGLPIYAWGIIGIAAGLAIVVIGAIIVKRRGKKTKTERCRECDDSTTNQQRTGTKKRVAIDYGGEGNDVDVEEVSVVSNISSLSGGTFVVRHDRV